MAHVKIAALIAMLCPLAGMAADPLVYVGTYARGGGKGIYAYRLQRDGGRLRPLGVVAEMADPSFLAVHPNGRFLYAVSESQGTVNAFAIEGKSGRLEFLNQVGARGQGPCHLALDGTGRWLAVANYESGTMALLPVEADGKLREASVVERHEGARGAHAHAVAFSPDNRFLLLADLGLNRVYVYRFDAARGTLRAAEPAFASPPAGSGVRHLAFHPSGKAVYAINETASTVTVFRFDGSTGALHESQTLATAPESFKGANTTAEIAVNAAGTLVYGSNRGHDSIALFAIDGEKLTLTAMDYAPTLGRTPRHFGMDPEGEYLVAANQDSSDVAVFRVHPNTGQLTPAGRPVADAKMPVCVVFVKQP